VLNLAPAVDVGRALLERLAVLVVNRSEAEHLLRAPLGAAADFAAAARALRALGPKAVVVTAGAEGAVVGDADGESHLPAVPVEVVDTAGAGDAFVGALAAELSRGRPLREAVAVATRAGAAAVQIRGAQLRSPSRAPVDEGEAG
jgi:ribokinase